MTIEVTVSGQKITVPYTDLVRNSKGVYTCEFTLDEDWEGLTCTAVFLNTSQSEAYEVALEDGACLVPEAVLKNVGNLYIGLYGTYTGITMPTVWSQPLSVVDGPSTLNGDGSGNGVVIIQSGVTAVDDGESNITLTD